LKLIGGCIWPNHRTDTLKFNLHRWAAPLFAAKVRLGTN